MPCRTHKVQLLLSTSLTKGTKVILSILSLMVHYLGYFEQFVVHPLLSITCVSYITNRYVVYMLLVLLAGSELLYLLSGVQSLLGVLNTYSLLLYKVSSSITSSSQSLLSSVIYSYMTLVLLCNLVGLIPYSFTLTALSFYSLFLSITLWIVKTGVVLDRYGLMSFLSRFYVNTLNIVVAYFLFIIELMSYCIPAVSLGLRLYVNLMASHVLAKVFVSFSLLVYKSYSFFNIFVTAVPLGVLVALNFLEVGVGVVQAYVYAVLSSLYLSSSFNTPPAH